VCLWLLPWLISFPFYFVMNFPVFAAASPITGAILAADSNAKLGMAGSFWICLAIVQVVGWTFVWRAGLHLRLAVREETPRSAGIPVGDSIHPQQEGAHAQ